MIPQYNNHDDTGMLFVCSFDINQQGRLIYSKIDIFLSLPR